MAVIVSPISVQRTTFPIPCSDVLAAPSGEMKSHVRISTGAVVAEFWTGPAAFASSGDKMTSVPLQSVWNAALGANGSIVFFPYARFTVKLDGSNASASFKNLRITVPHYEYNQ